MRSPGSCLWCHNPAVTFNMYYCCNITIILYCLPNIPIAIVENSNRWHRQCATFCCVVDCISATYQVTLSHSHSITLAIPCCRCSLAMSHFPQGRLWCKTLMPIGARWQPCIRAAQDTPYRLVGLRLSGQHGVVTDDMQCAATWDGSRISSISRISRNTLLTFPSCIWHRGSVMMSCTLYGKRMV